MSTKSTSTKKNDQSTKQGEGSNGSLQKRERLLGGAEMLLNSFQKKEEGLTTFVKESTQLILMGLSGKQESGPGERKE